MGQADLHLLGVVRGNAGYLPSWTPGAGLIRARDLAALVRDAAVPFVPGDVGPVQAHHRTLDLVMRHAAVLPMPFGIVLAGEEEVRHFLDEQHAAITEGLSLVDGHWEFRLHIGVPEPAEIPADRLAAALYGELRRMCRAAVPIPVDEVRRFSAAFLVAREASRRFVDRLDEMGTLHPQVTFDLTGPWPPYDFVHVTL